MLRNVLGDWLLNFQLVYPHFALKVSCLDASFTTADFRMYFRSVYVVIKYGKCLSYGLSERGSIQRTRLGDYS